MRRAHKQPLKGPRSMLRPLLLQNSTFLYSKNFQKHTFFRKNSTVHFQQQLDKRWEWGKEQEGERVRHRATWINTLNEPIYQLLKEWWQHLFCSSSPPLLPSWLLHTLDKYPLCNVCSSPSPLHRPILAHFFLLSFSHFSIRPVQDKHLTLAKKIRLKCAYGGWDLDWVQPCYIFSAWWVWVLCSQSGKKKALNILIKFWKYFLCGCNASTIPDFI